MIFLWSFEPIFYFYPGFNFTIVDWVYNWIILIEKKNNGKKSCKTALDIQKSDICIYITVHVLLKGNNFLPQNLKLVFQKDGWEHVNWNQLTKSINIYISSSSDKSEGKIGFTFLKEITTAPGSPKNLRWYFFSFVISIVFLRVLTWAEWLSLQLACSLLTK